MLCTIGLGGLRTWYRLKDTTYIVDCLEQSKSRRRDYPGYWTYLCAAGSKVTTRPEVLSFLFLICPSSAAASESPCVNDKAFLSSVYLFLFPITCPCKPSVSILLFPITCPFKTSNSRTTILGNIPHTTSIVLRALHCDLWTVIRDLYKDGLDTFHLDENDNCS